MREFRPEDPADPTRITLELRPGRNDVRALARTQDAEGRSEFRAVQCTAAPGSGNEADGLRPGDRGHGISGPRPRRARLVPRDASSFASVWEKQRDNHLYLDVKVKLLLDDNATRVKVNKKLDEIAEEIDRDRRAELDSILVVYASTHGVMDKPQHTFYLVPHDGRTKDLSNTALPSSRLFQLRRSLNVPFYLFLDTCHSGSVAAEQAAVDNDFRELFVTTSAAPVFAASRADQVAFQNVNRDKKSYFTQGILDLVSDPGRRIDVDPADGWISVRELARSLESKVKDLSKEGSPPSLPGWNCPVRIFSDLSTSDLEKVVQKRLARRTRAV